jgi:RNA-directed DNA polymerase
MNDRGKSDRLVVPGKRSNKGSGAPHPAESVEGRGLTKGNPGRGSSHRAQDRVRLENALARIRQVAERDREVKFTSLWHHVYDIARLREAYSNLKRKAAPGVDGVTWESYGEDLESNLVDLSARLRRGAYKPKPVKRVMIPKPDGRERPIGLTALEDKIVQSATATVLSAIYEVDFMGFSYGFRQGRSQHMALDALTMGIRSKEVNWVLDADIRGFFDTIDHEWLVKFVEHRVADQRVVRHIKKWLHSGALVDGEWMMEEEGTPQGGCISPLLANIYLHYALDLWVHQDRRKRKRDEMIIVRYADDFVMGFRGRVEAEMMLAELKRRLAKFNLTLHPDKTRILEFGRNAQRIRAKRGDTKPETFDFLGFTHCCSRSRFGRFTVRRTTMRKRMRAKLAAVSQELRWRLHDPIPEVGRWLGKILRGHYQYYGIPGNYRAMSSYLNQVIIRWRQVLGRRSQRGGVNWDRLRYLIRTYLPTPTIRHPRPEQRFARSTRGRSPVR